MRKIRGFHDLAVSFLALLILMGCASSGPAKVETPEAKPQPIEFPMNYKGNALESEPVTWEEAYHGGTYLFDQGKYELAFTYFLKGSELASGDAKKTCLMAAAVCSLGADAPEQYLEIRKQLKELVGKDPFKPPTSTDEAFSALEEVVR